MGYSQLGRGMSGMSQNYLSQAGTGFGQMASTSGQTAIGMGQLNNSYNSTMQSALASYNNTNANIYGTQQKAYTAAQNQKSESKGAMAGMAGSLGSAALGSAGGLAMFSDERLKDNIVKVGEINGIDIIKWDWNDEAKKIGIKDNTFGVSAQRVLKDHPDCVSVDYGTGYYMVNYNKLFSKEV